VHSFSTGAIENHCPGKEKVVSMTISTDHKRIKIRVCCLLKHTFIYTVINSQLWCSLTVECTIIMLLELSLKKLRTRQKLL
jgi:hypothetical protein